ncbi:unnamed protein product, partial [Rotaria magnacalcarata]
MVAGILLGFAYSWQLTLLMIVFLPLMLFGGFLQTRLTVYYSSKDKHILENAGKSSITRAHILSILFSIISAAVYFSIAAFISLGTFLVDRDPITFEDTFLVLNAVVLTVRTRFNSQKKALVGTSGCGRSTTIQLVEHFYDVNAGRL